MMEKYRQLLYEESMRNEPSAEMVMLYRVFLADERAALATEKKVAKEENLALKAQAIQEAANLQSLSQTVVTQPSTNQAATGSTDVKVVPSSTIGSSSTSHFVSQVMRGLPKSVTSNEVVAAVSSVSVPVATVAQSVQSSSALTNSSLKPNHNIDSKDNLKLKQTATSAVDAAVSSINLSSPENISKSKDEETERTLEILDSILADLANQPS